jgi:30S ribosomal protein S31
LRLARKAQQSNQEQIMGKGDRKTAKGKRTNASYGNARKHVVKAAVGVAAPAAKRTITKAAAPAKKAVAKKTVAKAG